MRSNTSGPRAFRKEKHTHTHTDDFRSPVGRRYVGHVHVDDARGDSDHNDQPGADSDRSTVQIRTQVHTQPQPAAAAADGHRGRPHTSVRQQIR